MVILKNLSKCHSYLTPVILDAAHLPDWDWRNLGRSGLGEHHKTRKFPMPCNCTQCS